MNYPWLRFRYMFLTKRYQCDFLALPRLLSKIAEDWCDTDNPLYLEDPGIFKDLGIEALERQMEDKMELLRTENRYRIESRINSLKRGSE